MQQYQPRFLRCDNCGEEFTFTAAAQQYWEEKGFTDDPHRCKECYHQLKAQQRHHPQPLDAPRLPA
ncbi:MAG: zinc-ribbon domain containing protein [Patescibacteria group bacterium]